MDFNKYFTNEELKNLLDSWLIKFPSLITLSELGKSYQGKSVWLATITNQSTGSDIDKPAVWIDANLHATELAGTTTALSIIHTLLTKFGNTDQITRILDNCVYYIAPRINPDGAALAMANPPKFIRSGVRPYPWEKKLPGLHGEDIDGDGRILQMRLIDPNGEWKISELDNRLMEPRKPDEMDGTYYRLLEEGLIEDYDGFQIQTPKKIEGLDFNRNFPIEWKPETTQAGAGPYPGSEIEIRNMLDFITSHKNINAAITYHTFSGVILRPPSTYPDKDMDANDLWTYKAIGERGTETTGYPSVSVYEDFRYHPKQVITGVFDDWMFGHLGIFAFTVELWDIVGESGIKDRKFIEWLRKHPHEDDLKILQWCDKNAGEGAYVDWYSFIHPQLGEVEIGGWNRMYTWRNPPHHLMGKEAERNIPFALSLADMLPVLSIHHFEITKLLKNTFNLTVILDNQGFFPTYTSENGKKVASIRPIQTTLELPEGSSFISGKRNEARSHLQGRSNKLGNTFSLSTATDNRMKIEWVFKSVSGMEASLEIQSDRAGKILKKFVLP